MRQMVVAYAVLAPLVAYLMIREDDAALVALFIKSAVAFVGFPAQAGR